MSHDTSIQHLVNHHQYSFFKFNIIAYLSLHLRCCYLDNFQSSFFACCCFLFLFLFARHSAGVISPSSSISSLLLFDVSFIFFQVLVWPQHLFHKRPFYIFIFGLGLKYVSVFVVVAFVAVGFLIYILLNICFLSSVFDIRPWLVLRFFLNL